MSGLIKKKSLLLGWILERAAAHPIHSLTLPLVNGTAMARYSHAEPQDYLAHAVHGSTGAMKWEMDRWWWIGAGRVLLLVMVSWWQLVREKEKVWLGTQHVRLNGYVHVAIRLGYVRVYTWQYRSCRFILGRGDWITLTCEPIISVYRHEVVVRVNPHTT